MTYVAPRAGAWIETFVTVSPAGLDPVAPRAGAWIETGKESSQAKKIKVAPRAGAWIETPIEYLITPYSCSRTPCGCVD